MRAYEVRGIGQITDTPKEDGTDGCGLAYENNADPSNDTVPTEKTTQGGKA